MGRELGYEGQRRRQAAGVTGAEVAAYGFVVGQGVKQRRKMIKA